MGMAQELMPTAWSMRSLSSNTSMSKGKNLSIHGLMNYTVPNSRWSSVNMTVLGGESNCIINRKSSMKMVKSKMFSNWFLILSKGKVADGNLVF